MRAKEGDCSNHMLNISTAARCSSRSSNPSRPVHTCNSEDGEHETALDENYFKLQRADEGNCDIIHEIEITEQGQDNPYSYPDVREIQADVDQPYSQIGSTGPQTCQSVSDNTVLYDSELYEPYLQPEPDRVSECDSTSVTDREGYLLPLQT